MLGCQSLQLDQHLVDAHAVDILHDEVLAAVVSADPENGHDVRMVKSSDRLGLATKTLLLAGHVGGVGPKKLQGNRSFERLLFRFVNDPHAALSDLPDDAKIAKVLADASHCRAALRCFPLAVLLTPEVTVHHPELLEAAGRFCREFRWKGPFELECIIRDGEIFLIEINPRFPAWTYFATGVGVNLPSQLIRCCLGMPNGTSHDYPAGKMLVRYSYEFVSDMTPFQTLITTGETP